MKRYFNRLIWDSIHKGFVKIFGEKGAFYAEIGIFALIFITVIMMRFLR